MTTLVKIEIMEEDKESGEHVYYELAPGTLPAEQLEELCQIVERSGLLEHDEIHYGPLKGEHEVSIAVETASSTHEIHACDTDLSGAQEQLASFVKELGQKHDTSEA